MSIRQTLSLLLALAVLSGSLDRLWTQLSCPTSADEKADEKETTQDKKDPQEKPVVGKDGQPIENPFPRRFPAPSLDGGKGWLNTSGEISLKDLRGKVVVLDFWTYCCINCMHVLPDLEFLEKKYAKELVVIGVHSAKFDNEKDTEAIRKAIVRYEIEHPVINDSEMTVWRKFGANSWPTLVLLDPEGNYCGFVSGEGNRELLDGIIGKVIEYHKAKGTLDETPVRFDLERNRHKSGPLKFPGKLLVDEANKRLFISDSNHNRIVISNLDGKLIDVIGTGSIGAKNGGYDEAQFDHPQGMELVGDTLYVADTENHMIRTVDLTAKKVSTLSGTGKQARFRANGGPIDKVALNSPWDLDVVDGVLYIAMAGPHQIWSHKLGSKMINVHAGSGREDITNGPLADSALAQPSGLTNDGRFLYVADSEGSAVRKVDTKSDGNVTTLIGTHDLPRGRALFEFGDVDGGADDARLQHPLHAEFYKGKLYVADAYNHKIKVIDPEKRTSQTLLGDGKAGDRLAPLRLSEPAGIAFGGGKMFIADTNNSRIVAVTLGEKNEASVFTVDGLKPPTPPKESGESGSTGAGIKVDDQKISGKSVTVSVKLKYPADYKVNSLYPTKGWFSGDKTQTLIVAESFGKRTKGKLNKDTDTFEVEFPLTGKSGKADLKFSLTYSYCRGGQSGLCKIRTVHFDIPLEVVAGGNSTIKLETDQPDK